MLVGLESIVTICFVKITVIIMEFVKMENVFAKQINGKGKLVMLEYARIIALGMENA
jgi:hypothetical protein